MPNKAPKKSLETIINELTNQILLTLSVIGLLAVVVSSIRALELGLKPVMFLHFTLWVACSVMYINRDNIAQRTRAYLVVSLLFIAGAVGILTFGLSGSGSTILLATTIISALLINNKVSIIVLVLSSLTIALTTFLQHINYLTIAELTNSTATLYAWYTELIGFVLFATVISLAINKFLQYLIQANDQLHQEVENNSSRAEQSERLLKAVLDALPYRVFWKDKDLNYVGANTAFLNDAGLTSLEQITGKSDYELPWQEQAKMFRADDTEVMDSQQAKLNIEERLTPSEGETKYLLTNKVPLIDDQQQVFGILGAFDDISTQKSLELELRQAKIEAEQASVAKTEFLSNMSHEIRTPLNGINGLLELSLATELSELQRDYLEKTSESAKLLHAILNDILDISKIEAGKFELENIDFSLTENITNLGSFLQPLVDEKGIKLVIVNTIANNIIYHGDPTRLMQILLNLANNAIKFTEKGQVTISCSITNKKETAHFCCDITDNGIGISAEQLPRLFKNFSQADSSMSRRFGGTGLGLAIVKKIVDMMYGEINVSSELGKGSTFSLSLPLKLGKDTVLKKDLAIDPLVTLNNLDILLVEDNRINQMIALKILKQYGAQVSVANDGIEALDQLEQLEGKSFDIILMDIQMPNMNGCDAIKKIRFQEKYKALPVIALTANVMSHEVKSYYELGFNAHVGKPFKSDELISKIYELVQK